ncbi:MAG: recombinase family protein [Rhizobiaceae bacterium]
MMDGINTIQRVAAREASLKALDKPWLDLSTPVGRGILAFLSALAEDERERIVRRGSKGRAIAKANGVKFGPKPKLSRHQKGQGALVWPKVTVFVRLLAIWGVSLHDLQIGKIATVRSIAADDGVVAAEFRQ